MSSYLVQSEDLDREETRRLSDKVRGHARLTLETLHQVRKGRSRLGLTETPGRLFL